jgi:hypothetical protein
MALALLLLSLLHFARPCPAELCPDNAPNNAPSNAPNNSPNNAPDNAPINTPNNSLVCIAIRSCNRNEINILPQNQLPAVRLRPSARESGFSFLAQYPYPADPTVNPTVSPTVNPTVSPTVNPTLSPTVKPTVSPTVNPTVKPSLSTVKFATKLNRINSLPKNFLPAAGLRPSAQIPSSHKTPSSPLRNRISPIRFLSTPQLQSDITLVAVVVDRKDTPMKEIPKTAASGYLMFVFVTALFIASVFVLVSLKDIPKYEPKGGTVFTGVTLMVVSFLLSAGFFTVHPNKGVVLQLFGKYIGTVTQTGLRWANPFFTKKAVSLRVRNFETSRLKVNDQDGNPIEIGAVVVWKVVDTAEAVFQVDEYENYVHVQSEAALRNLATAYPYDTHEGHEISLRGNTNEVATRLRTEIEDRLSVAGVHVEEARISHLAYAPEIAAAMLQRQQAGAIIAARQKIVEGAVGMVEMALKMLADGNILNLDEEKKAAMVSNLLVVLCGDRNTQPVVNAGTLHH